MSYQSGCHGRVILGPLPADVQRRLTVLPGEWLEYNPQTGAVEIGHVQPSTAPILPTVTVELVRILSEIPYDLQSRIVGGDYFVHTEEPATQLVRIRVEAGGSLHIQWAHPEYAGAAREPWSEAVRIATPEWEHRLNGTVTFEADDAAPAAETLQTLADTYEGLYPEGDFKASADGDAVTVDMSEVNLDGGLLTARMVTLARPGSLEGRFEVGSFADFVPENLVRFLFEAGEVSVQHPLLWS
ncbi:MAG: hypothetical protein HKP01_03385 [Gemmatimonadetes bacterium]|nr:hypothetical protein [Gemmatimonadota bacterium]